MQSPEYGPLFPGVQLPKLEIIGVTDLGPGNLGAISAADLNSDERAALIQDIGVPKYHLPPTNRFRCVDGRIVAGGLQAQTLPGHADPQLAGGVAISETASGMLVVKKQLIAPVGEQIGNNTRWAIIGGVIVRVHGDTHHAEEGCGANVKMRESLGLTAEPGNHDLLVGKAWTLAQLLRLDRMGVREEDASLQLRNVERNVNDDWLWDTTPAQNVEIAVANGAEYEEVVDDHTERAIVASVSVAAFAEEDFMHDHPVPDGTNREAFVASLGAYTRWKLETARMRGLNQRETGLGILGVVIYNLAVPKVLTAEETGQGEALPVVIVGPASE